MIPTGRTHRPLLFPRLFPRLLHHTAFILQPNVFNPIPTLSQSPQFRCTKSPTCRRLDSKQPPNSLLPANHRYSHNRARADSYATPLRRSAHDCCPFHDNRLRRAAPSKINPSPVTTNPIRNASPDTLAVIQRAPGARTTRALTSSRTKLSTSFPYPIGWAFEALICRATRAASSRWILAACASFPTSLR